MVVQLVSEYLFQVPSITGELGGIPVGPVIRDHDPVPTQSRGSALSADAIHADGADVR